MLGVDDFILKETLGRVEKLFVPANEQVSKARKAPVEYSLYRLLIC